MRAGQLDSRVSFLAAALVEDDVYGPQPGEFEPVLTPRIPAQVWDNLPGQDESVQGGAHVADRPARVRMRYLDGRGVTSDMRMVLHDETDRLYEITGGPAELGRREWIELTVKAFSS